MDNNFNGNLNIIGKYIGNSVGIIIGGVMYKKNVTTNSIVNKDTFRRILSGVQEGWFELYEPTIDNIESVVKKELDKIAYDDTEVRDQISSLQSEMGNTGKEITQIKAGIEQVSSQIAENANLLNARMDTFTTLTEGSTTGDAELADGRVGTNGITYNNIGEHIRTIENGESILDEAITPSKTNFMNRKINLYDNKSVNNLSINNSGTNYQLSGNYASEKINIEGFSKLYVKNIKNVAFYSTDGTFIKINPNTNVNILTLVNIPENAANIRYSVSSSNISIAFISLTNEELFVEEIGFKLPISNLSDNEFRAKLKEFENVLEITQSNCDFFNNPINLYDNKTINDLGINNLGTLYPVTGGYTSKDIEISSNRYVYPFKISKILFKDESDAIVKIIQDAKAFQKIEVPLNAVKFSYSVQSTNISSANIYLTDYELSGNPPMPTIKNEYINIEGIKNIINSKSFNTTIACYGDSLTEGAGSTNAGVYSYPARLQEIINANAKSYQVSVLNRGIGGNTSKPIIAKSGCYADMVEPFTIPTDTTPVAITKNGILANSVGGNISIRNGVNPVTIGGIEGNLSYADGTYKFARLEAGEEVQITRPVQILPSASKTDKNAILIICVGTNDADKTEADYPPKLIQRIRRIIEYLDCKKFIVLGLTKGKENVNPALEEEFGANFLDIHKYLINYGLSDNELTATNEDLEDISNGLIPRQIRSDNIHYNNQGYYAKAMGIYLKGKDLGYWL